MIETLDERTCSFDPTDVALIEAVAIAQGANSATSAITNKKLFAAFQRMYPAHRITEFNINSFCLALKVLSCCVSDKNTNIDLACDSSGAFLKTRTGASLYFYNDNKKNPTSESINSSFMKRGCAKGTSGLNKKVQQHPARGDASAASFSSDLIGGSQYERARQMILQGISDLPGVSKNEKLQMFSNFESRYYDSILEKDRGTDTQEIY
jgi:hypothetical protein